MTNRKNRKRWKQWKQTKKWPKVVLRAAGDFVRQLKIGYQFNKTYSVQNVCATASSAAQKK